MLDLLSFISTLYLDHYTGELAGMSNIILQPSFVLGTRNDPTLTKFPNWHNSVDLYAIYGSALAGRETTGQTFQEVRGKVTSLYTFYNSDDVLTFNTGLYSLLAYSLHNYSPYIDPATNMEYAAEENEKINKEELVGWDFNFDVNYDKSASSLHNIFYFSGKRIGPNILAYQPVLGFDWRHEIFILGTKARPRLSLFANLQFWFARKASAKLLNSHDGIGATKRELYLSYGISYFISDKTAIYVESYGYNNLNRGSSATDPKGFRDGSIVGIRHTFE
jgi:hypothetical protein